MPSQLTRGSRRKIPARLAVPLLGALAAAGLTACSDSSPEIREPANFRGVVVNAEDGTPLEAEVRLTWDPDDCFFCPGFAFATRTSSAGAFDLRFDLANDRYAVRVSSRDWFSVPGGGDESFQAYRGQTTYASAAELAAEEFRFELAPAGVVEYRLSRPLLEGERVTVQATGDRYGATSAYFNPGGPNPRRVLSAAGTSPLSISIGRADGSLDVRTGSVSVEHRGFTVFTVDLD